MKQIYINTLLVVLALLSGTTVQAYDFEAGGIYYTKSGSNATVTSGDNLYTGTVVIPAPVENEGTTYQVTAIGNLAFQNCIHLTAVTIGSNVTTIGYQAFIGCDELEEIVIPANVTTLGDYYGTSNTFKGCTNLTNASKKK